MAKILLVEDDKSLREIYGVRLEAEGYEIVSAGDGEEALATAIKERPDLIISDVMMPKISGFDMLDILRSTTETKGVKVIMMTALSSDDQRARGEALGADRYLVKSQVGIEDVVRTVHDVLTDTPGAAPAVPTVDSSASGQSSAAPDPAPTIGDPIPPTLTIPTDPVPPVPVADLPDLSIPTVPTVDPAVIAPDPVAPTPPIADTPPLAPTEPTFTPPVAPVPVDPPVLAPAPAAPAPPMINMAPEVPPMAAPEPDSAAPQPMPPAPVTPPPANTPLPEPTAPFSSPAPASLADRIISPISPQDTTVQRPPNMSDLMNQELQQASDPTPPPPAPPIPPSPGE